MLTVRLLIAVLALVSTAAATAAAASTTAPGASVVVTDSGPAPSDSNDSGDPAAMELLLTLKSRELALTLEIEKVKAEKKELLKSRRLNIGIIGFGTFGQFLAKTFSVNNNVYASSRSDYTDLAQALGVKKYVPLDQIGELLRDSDPDSDSDSGDSDSDDAWAGLDVLVIAVSIVSFEKTLLSLAPILAQRTQDLLIVDVLSVKEHPREILIKNTPSNVDILATHPMFGPESGKHGWEGLPFVYDPVRISSSPHRRDVLERFLSVWDEQGCVMKEMTCSQHDQYAASSQFVTHLVGRLLGDIGANLKATPIDTRGFEALLKLIENTNADSFELFYGLYTYNQNSKAIIAEVRRSLEATVELLDSADAGRLGETLREWKLLNGSRSGGGGGGRA